MVHYWMHNNMITINGQKMGKSLGNFITTYDMPWDEENGVYDFESPLCMDLPLLHDHLAKLARGQEINIPTFDFAHKMRTGETKSLTLDPDEIVVIEGIHAFNDVLMGLSLIHIWCWMITPTWSPWVRWPM